MHPKGGGLGKFTPGDFAHERALLHRPSEVPMRWRPGDPSNSSHPQLCGILSFRRTQLLRVGKGRPMTPIDFP
jgi:hypothetical protein